MIQIYTYEAKTLFYFSFQENIENFKCSEELFIAIEILDNTGIFFKLVEDCSGASNDVTISIQNLETHSSDGGHAVGSINVVSSSCATDPEAIDQDEWSSDSSEDSLNETSWIIH